MVLGKLTIGRHTFNPGARHSIQTNQQFFTLDALPVATLPIYPSLGQAQEYAGLHTSMAWFMILHTQSIFNLIVTGLQLDYSDFTFHI